MFALLHSDFPGGRDLARDDLFQAREARIICLSPELEVVRGFAREHLLRFVREVNRAEVFVQDINDLRQVSDLAPAAWLQDVEAGLSNGGLAWFPRLTHITVYGVRRHRDDVFMPMLWTKIVECEVTVPT